MLCVCPYYSRPSQAGIAAHVGGDRERDRPARHALRHPRAAGRRITTETVLALAREHRNVVAVKDASGDLAGAARLVAEAPSGFEVYSGDDALVLPFLAVGAVGLVSVASHWCGTELTQVLSLFVKGDLDGAIAQHATLLDSFAFETTERWPNPLPAKAALRARGLGVGQCRLPMGDADAELDAPRPRSSRGSRLAPCLRRRSGSPSSAAWGRSAGTAAPSRSTAG